MVNNTFVLTVAVKLSDFGLAVQVPNSKELLDISTAPLPLWSMAPESLEVGCYECLVLNTLT